MVKLSILPDKHVNVAIWFIFAYCLVFGVFIYFDYLEQGNLEVTHIIIILIGIVSFIFSLMASYNRRIIIYGNAIQGIIKEWPEGLNNRLRDTDITRSVLSIGELKLAEFKTVTNEKDRDIPILLLKTNDDFYLDVRGFSDKQKNIIQVNLKKINSRL